MRPTGGTVVTDFQTGYKKQASQKRSAWNALKGPDVSYVSSSYSDVRESAHEEVELRAVIAGAETLNPANVHVHQQQPATMKAIRI